MVTTISISTCAKYWPFEAMQPLLLAHTVLTFGSSEGIPQIQHAWEELAKLEHKETAEKGALNGVKAQTVNFGIQHDESLVGQQ